MISSINKTIPSCIYHLVHLLSIRLYHIMIRINCFGTRFSLSCCFGTLLLSIISLYKRSLLPKHSSSTKMSFCYYYDVFFDVFSGITIGYILLNNIATIKWKNRNLLRKSENREPKSSLLKPLMMYRL